MSKIRIKNFGPIKEGFLENDGWLEVKKVTVFIGNQGSGKSTVAKLISTFTWIEKALVRGDYDNKWFSRKSKLKNQFLNYHRLENYLISNGRQSEIEYDGDAYNIKFEKEALTIREKKNVAYDLPQIMYVPAERNFIAYVKSPKELKLSSDSLKEFLAEFDNAKDAIKGSVKLPINNVELEYDKLNDILNIKGEDYKVRLTESSSGFQSLVPLYLVSDFLSNGIKETSRENLNSMSSEELERFKTLAAEIYSNENLTSEQRRAALSAISSRFNKTCFINIVEEPEQNLFPSSQHSMLNSLVMFNNQNKGNKLIMTTHSPYLINYLTLAVKADLTYTMLSEKKYKFGDPQFRYTNEIVPMSSTVKADDLVIYELNENNGSIIKLGSFEGIPSDKNYLNQSLAETNRLFDSLLEIEEEL